MTVKDNTDTSKGKGKVWLVGAGPGDPGLITVKGLDVLRKADVIVCDALIGGGVLAHMPAGAELIYAGKRAGDHTLKQEEINRILLEKALEGLNVVRLKGGDPFVFGRGGEELELLVSNGVDYEIVPGVTSAFAVPAYSGIPVTHREYSSSVHVITGHRRKDHTFDIDFASLAKTHGTLVFLMGISSLRMIVSGLIGAGMDPSTPAAVIEKGTTAAQKTLSSVLGKLEEDAVNAGIATPAIIIIGQVVSLAVKLAWHDKLPLDGIRTVVTRPKELSSRLAGMLREQGAEVIELPTVRIVPAEDSADLDRAIDELADQAYDWLVFTSPSGVRIFMERIFRDHDIRILAGCRIACIGRGSERELGKYGIRPDMVPSEYNGQALGIQLAALLNEGDRVLIPRARIGNPELIEELSKVRDVIIDDIPSYDTEYTGASWFDADTAFNDECTYAVFTSASTVRGFVNSWPDMDHSKVRAVCIGRLTAREAQSHGMRTFVSSEATLESLVSELISVRRIDK